MSHSFKWVDVREGTFRFHYNSDLSGTVKMAQFDDKVAVAMMEVPGRALIEFVAEYVRRKRISELESMSTEEVLGIKP